MLTAAIRLGCVNPIMPRSPRPAARHILGICVVLPDPVSPVMTTTWFFRTVSMIIWRFAVMGNSAGKVKAGTDRRRF
ncbi:MAG TPA: hypothetical protein DDZ34_07905 [Syntrophaceae bacterium]|nr:hypothetical protein [Syntrophaceae bacterium]